MNHNVSEFPFIPLCYYSVPQKTSCCPRENTSAATKYFHAFATSHYNIRNNDHHKTKVNFKSLSKGRWFPMVFGSSQMVSCEITKLRVCTLLSTYLFLKISWFVHTVCELKHNQPSTKLWPIQIMASLNQWKLVGEKLDLIMLIKLVW